MKEPQPHLTLVLIQRSSGQGPQVWSFLTPSKESEGSLGSSEGAWLRSGQGRVPGPPRLQAGASEEEQKGPPTTDTGNLSPTLPLMSTSKSPRWCPQMCCFQTSILGAWGTGRETSSVGCGFGSADGSSHPVRHLVEDTKEGLRRPLTTDRGGSSPAPPLLSSLRSLSSFPQVCCIWTYILEAWGRWGFFWGIQPWFNRGNSPRPCHTSRWGSRRRTQRTSHCIQTESHRNPPLVLALRGPMHGHQVKTNLDISLTFFFWHVREMVALSWGTNLR